MRKKSWGQDISPCLSDISVIDYYWLQEEIISNAACTPRFLYIFYRHYRLLNEACHLPHGPGRSRMTPQCVAAWVIALLVWAFKFCFSDSIVYSWKMFVQVRFPGLLSSLPQGQCFLLWEFKKGIKLWNSLLPIRSVSMVKTQTHCPWRRLMCSLPPHSPRDVKCKNILNLLLYMILMNATINYHLSLLSELKDLTMSTSSSLYGWSPMITGKCRTQ